MHVRASRMTPEAYANMSKAHTLIYDLPKLVEMTGEADRVLTACKTCGKVFLPAGLASHRVQCAGEKIPPTVTCEACGRTVRRYCLNRHKKTCKGAVK